MEGGKLPSMENPSLPKIQNKATPGSRNVCTLVDPRFGTLAVATKMAATGHPKFF